MYNEWLITLVKYLVLSGVLTLLFFVLKGRVSYSLQRLFLLTIIPLSLLASIVSIGVFKIEMEVEQSAEWSGQVYELESDPLNMAVIEPKEQASSKEHVLRSALQNTNWPLVLWVAIAALLLIRLISSIVKILSLRKFADKEYVKSYPVYRSELVEAPFSFLRSIYIDRKIEGENFDVIIEHELAHIEHGHYVDKMIVELLIVLSWFNPALWLIRKQLCLIHEFEADSSVLCVFPDHKKYKQFLFDQIRGHSPQVANGFNNSLIKQRFLEMEKSYQGKSLLRKTLTALVVLVVISASSLTQVVGKTTAKAVESSSSSEIPSLKVEFLNGNTIEVAGEQAIAEIMGLLNSPDSIKSLSVKTSKNTPSSTSTSGSNANIDFYDLSRDQYILLDQSNKNIRYRNLIAYQRDGYTEVDIAFNIPSNKYWIGFSDEIYLVDKNSGDRYKIHSIKNNVPLNRYCWFKNQAGHMAVVTLIFPPLKDGVKDIEMLEFIIKGDRPSHNSGSGPWTYSNIKLMGNVERAYKDISKSEIITLPENFEVK